VEMGLSRTGGDTHVASAALEEGELEAAEDALRSALDLAPEDAPRLRLALARLMLRRGNTIWALRELSALESEGHEVSFELGYCLHRLGEHEQAVDHLVLAASSESERAGMAALYGADAFESMGQGGEALRLAERAASDELDPAVAEAGQSLVRALRRQVAGEQRVLFSAFAAVSGGYDSNPVLAPDDAPTHAAAPRLWLRAGLFSEPFGGERWALGVVAIVSRDQSFEQAARPFDYTSTRAGARLRLGFGERVDQELRIGYEYSLGLLDGGQGVEEDSLYAYTELHSGVLSYSFELSEVLLTRLQATTGFARYHNRARSGSPMELSVGQTLFLLGGDLKLYLRGGLRAAWTRSPKYDRRGPVLVFAASYLTPLWGLEALASWSYGWSLYPESSGVDFGFNYARPELRRRDSIHRITAQIDRPFLSEHLRLGLRYRFTDSDSSIASYRYQRHVLELAVTGEL